MSKGIVGDSEPVEQRKISMCRITTLATALILLLVSGVGEAAFAQGGNSCPPGTCNPKGGPVAKDLKFCSASNCQNKPNGTKGCGPRAKMSGAACL